MALARKSASELAVEYGFAEAFFRAEPELWNLFQRARKGRWNPTKFQGEFMRTGWYRSREASVRQWADLMTRDPAEARNKIAESKAELADRFSQLGITVDNATLTRLSTERLQWSWSETQTNDILAAYFKYRPGGTGGDAAGVETNIRGLAFDYGVDVSNSQMQDWISGIIGQRYTEESLRDFITDMARSKYGGMQGYLDAGLSVRQVASPYLQEYSRLLETSADTVDLNDPLVASALQGRVDPKTGLPVMQTVSQFQKAVKSDRRWLYTENARTEMVDTGMNILRDMGLYS